MATVIPSNVLEIPLTRGHVALVDPEDFGWLTAYRWCTITPGSNRVYAVRYAKRDGKRTCFYMHRQILGDPVDLHVDHRNGNGLHNWRANLRPATNQQNLFNSSAKPINTSGFKGVVLYGNRTKYRAMIMVSGKQIHLGCRDTREEAARLYDAAALHYFGEFARLNFPIEVQSCAL